MNPGEASGALDAASPEAAVSVWRLRWRRFSGHGAGMASLFVLAAMVLFTLAHDFNVGRVGSISWSSAS